jgi:hypothetical protein
MFECGHQFLWQDSSAFPESVRFLVESGKGAGAVEWPIRHAFGNDCYLLKLADGLCVENDRKPF